jgi:prolyl-tRNA synthetase
LEKQPLSLSDIEKSVNDLLNDIQKNMYIEAKQNLDKNTFKAETIEELKDIIGTKGGFVKAMWCGDEECENRLKEEVGVTSRCIPFAQEEFTDKCICCGKKAKHMVVWAVAY